jgi:endogenous inhibitor of DNA gyrase (YacG/DUF329 family)
MAKTEFLTPYPIDQKIIQMWKNYPIRVSGHSISQCCRKPTILVLSMQGGYVSRNCPECGSPTTLPEDVFLEKLDLYVACPTCKARMAAEILFNKNYGYTCQVCKIYIDLASLLPRWTDL